jgi:uncharacterized membrane protein
MADLTEAQKAAYWRYNIRLTTWLLVIWFVVTYIISGLIAGWLNHFSFLGFPLGYYMAVYAWFMNRKDLEMGIREEG